MQESLAAFKDFTLDDASGQKPKPKSKPKKEPKQKGKAKQKPDEGKPPKQDAKAAPPPPKSSSGIALLLCAQVKIEGLFQASILWLTCLRGDLGQVRSTYESHLHSSS